MPSPENIDLRPPNLVAKLTPGEHAMNEPPVRSSESPDRRRWPIVPGADGENVTSPPNGWLYSPTNSDSPPVTFLTSAGRKPPSRRALTSVPLDIQAIEPPSAMKLSPGLSLTVRCP